MSDDRRRRKDDRSRRHREKTYHGEGSINRDAAIANVRRQEGYVYDEEDTSRSRADPSNPRNANSVSALTSDLGRLSVGSAESTDVQSDHYTTASQYDSVSSYPSGYVAQASYDTTYQTTAAGSYPTTSIPNTYQTSYPYAGTSEDPAVYSTPPATYPDPQAVAASSAYSNYPTPQQWTSPSTLYTENSYLTSSNPAAAQHTQSQGSVREGYSSGERYRESYSDQGNTPYYSTPPQYGNYSPSRREPPAAASPFTYPTTSYEQPGSANMQYPSTEQYYSQDHRQPQISTGYTPQRPALSEPVPGPLLQCGCLGCDRDKLKLPSSEDGTDSQKKGSSSSKKGVSSRAGHSSSRGAESSRSNVPSVSKSASFEITPMGSSGSNCGALNLPDGIKPWPKPHRPRDKSSPEEDKNYEERYKTWKEASKAWRDTSCLCLFGYFNDDAKWVPGSHVRLWLRDPADPSAKPPNPRWKENKWKAPKQRREGK